MFTAAFSAVSGIAIAAGFVAAWDHLTPGNLWILGTAIAGYVGAGIHGAMRWSQGLAEKAFEPTIRRLDARPGDRFLITFREQPPMERLDRLRAAWTAFAGHDAKLLVLVDGAEMHVIPGEALASEEPRP
jgi:hypothetical protein